MVAAIPKVDVRSVGDHRLFVIDGLFKPDFVRALHAILSRQSFSLSDYDTDETEEVRHWKCEFPPAFFAANPLLQAWHREVVAKARELCAGRSLTLVRVHANSHLFGDHQHPHTDFDPGVTALYFANPEWRAHWQGETIFYDAVGEPLAALAPVPGRLALFDGGMLHRGGVPSRTCFDARLSVAFKFSADAESGGSRD